MLWMKLEKDELDRRRSRKTERRETETLRRQRAHGLNEWTHQGHTGKGSKDGGTWKERTSNWPVRRANRHLVRFQLS